MLHSLLTVALTGWPLVHAAINATNTTAVAGAPPASAVYRNPHAPIESRVQDLVSRMTIEEKMAQLMQGDISNWLDTSTGAFNQSGLVANMAQKAGQFYVGYPISYEWLTENIQIGQNYLVNQTRLGIPALVQTEGIHGFLIGNATIFNSPIGYGCSWNTALIQKMGQVIGVEAAALGVNQLFAPLADLARELRYGRVEETNSEDPYLAGEVAYNYIVGLQSMNVSATVKHFTAFSAPEQGLNTGPVHGGERELRTTWLPSYKRAIIDAGAYSIMSSYNSYDGQPIVSSQHILTEILRNEWGYDYWVTGDAGSVDRMFSPFAVCAPKDANCATLNTLPAGNDVEMGGGSFNFRMIPSLVASGALSESIVDTAVARQLRSKFSLGLFEHPFTAAPASQWPKLINTAAHKTLARNLDKESIVLLQNPSKVLPLSKTSKVAMIGPMVSGWMNYGDYVVYESQYRGITYLEGMQNAAAHPSLITYAQGCERWSADESQIASAVATAEAADVAVVVVGTWSRDQTELWEGLNATTGEHVDVGDLSLVGAMGPLVRAVIATGKPTVVVFSSGKPITEPWLSGTSASLVQHFYPGEQGGNALADVLYGDYNPSGKLSVSFPYTVGALPVFHDYLNSGRQITEWGIDCCSGTVEPNGTLVFGHQYVLDNPNAWFPFGYGLSYTTFSYSNVTLSSYTASLSDTITATVHVTNTGAVQGTEVVQLYVVDVLGSVDRPNQSLKGFDKVVIPAGKTVAVKIPVAVEDLGLWNVNMQYVVEPGEFVIMMGGSSAAADLTNFAVLTVS